MALDVIQFLLAGLADNSGNPLNGGKVYAYAAGTTTPKDTFTDSTGTTPSANPIILDANGRKQAYAYGAYKFVLKTSADVLIDTFDNITIGNTAEYVSTVGGSANAITLTPSPAVAAYATGQRFVFLAANSCTSATTLNVSGLGAKSVKLLIYGAKANPVAGDIVAGSWYAALYDGTDFILSSVYSAPSVNVIQSSSYQWLGTTGGTANVLTASATPSLRGVAAGQTFRFVAGSSNTTSVTINIDSHGAENVYKQINASNNALQAGDIVAGRQYEIRYDGTQFILMNPSFEAQTYTPTVTSITGSAWALTRATYWRRPGRRIMFEIEGVLTYTSGSCTPVITLPVTAANTSFSPSCHFEIAGGTFLAAAVPTSTTQITIRPLTGGYSGSFNTSANPIRITGEYTEA